MATEPRKKSIASPWTRLLRNSLRIFKTSWSSEEVLYLGNLFYSTQEDGYGNLWA